ncbi:hypothetical protein CCUG62472_02430 [Mycobacteroides salmoniphilum]|nr:hypothetical protein CCUG62472_02430 [Mycobacteroides salmoniphilum]
MELRLLFEPAWVRYMVFLAYGWLLAGLLILFGAQWDGPEKQFWIVVGFSALGLLVGWSWKFHARRYHRLMGDVPAGQYLDVYRAITRGRVPEDPALRSAAIAVAQRYLNQAMQGRRFGIGMSVLWIGVCVFNARAMNWDGSAPNVSVAWLAFAVLAAFQAVQNFRVPRLVQARLQLLTAADQPVVGEPV